MTTPLLYTLQLMRTPGIGPASYASLLELCQTPQQAVEQLPALCRQRGRKLLTPPPLQQIEAEVAALQKLGGTFVLQQDKVQYPPALQYIQHPPPVLGVLGDAGVLNTPCVAIVGTRRASAAGIKFTRQLAGALAQAGWTVVSGLARGIDSAAHEGALAAGGKTIAVMAGGVDHIYPKENIKLHAEIIQNGCVVSEMPLGMVPMAGHFPRRNRLISGLSLGLAVIEAGLKSGSLISAQYALEQGRDVFAVPGAPGDERSSGPNHLLRQGAVLLEKAEDILQHLQPQAEPGVKMKKTARVVAPLFDVATQQEIARTEQLEEQAAVQAEDTPAARVMACLSRAPTGIDELVRQSGVSEAEVLIYLTDLDMEGRLLRHPGGAVSLC